MNLLFPAMLAGFAGLAVPIALHLIARSRFPVWDFPTIRLLRYEKRDNVFARKLVDPWQLLLRLLVIALLVAAMARIFLPRLSAKPAPRNLVVVLDSSASMKMAARESSEDDPISTLDQAKRIAARLLSEIALPSRCALITVGDEMSVVPMAPTPDAALLALEPVVSGGGTGPGLVRAVAQSCEMIRGRREVKSQIVVLTDLRASAFRTRNQRDLQEIAEARSEIGDALEIIVVDVGASDAENVAILDAYLRGDKARMNDDAHVITRVQNLGAEPQPAKLILTVAGKQEAAFHKLSLGPGEEAIVDLTSHVKHQLRSFASVVLQESDAVMHDNVFSVPFVVVPVRKVLIVNGASEVDRSTSMSIFGGFGGEEELEEEVIDGARIMQYVLNPAEQLEGNLAGTGLKPKVITPEKLAGETLSSYHVVILYDVNELPGQAAKDFYTYVRSGRSVLIICSAQTNPVDFNDNLANPEAEYGALSPAKIGVEQGFSTPIGLRLSNGSESATNGAVSYTPGPWLAPFRNQRQGGIRVIRIAKAREIRNIENGANVLLQGTGGQALAVEAKRGEGRVVLFGFGVELSRGNIAMTKAFPLLTWRLIDYLTGKLRAKPKDSLVASEPAALDASETEFLVDELEPVPDLRNVRPAPGRRPIDAPRTTDMKVVESEEETSSREASVPDVEPRILPISAQKTVMIDGLPVGHYRLRKKLGRRYARPITVNPDPRESEMTRVGEDEMHAFFSKNARIVKPQEVEGIAPTGLEAWPLIVALLMLAYLVEAVSAYVIGVLRAKKLEAEEAI